VLELSCRFTDESELIFRYLCHYSYAICIFLFSLPAKIKMLILDKKYDANGFHDVAILAVSRLENRDLLFLAFDHLTQLLRCTV